MNLLQTLWALLLWIVYPAWLLAGAMDYVCHRRTDIEHTSGVTESLLHLAQFAALVVFLCAILLFGSGTMALTIAVLAVLAHSTLSLIDTSYTLERRLIGPFEQWVHGYLDVLPIVAAALIVVLCRYEPRVPLDQSGALLLIGSFVCLAGFPIFEELWRTTRRARSARLVR